MTKSYYIAEMAETTTWNRDIQILPSGETHSSLTLRPRVMSYFYKKQQMS